ncbi:transposase [Parabacteroides distasonis]|nr:transposase [Parabacteroides distasonis]
MEADAPVRFFDAFVDNRVDVKKLGFVRSVPKETGTPGYDPRDLLKLYIYGYFYQVRSSRKLARECRCNVEMMWLINKLTPDFRTISDFRKDNKEAIAKVFKKFNKFCMDLKLFSKSYISIDGSKFKAVNAKDNNFTLSKLDDRIKRLNEHISLYLEELDAYDESDDRKLSKDELSRKLEVCQNRKELYEGYREQLQSSGERQISLTDGDARLMKANEGFCVGYNVQTAVDSENHMIVGYKVTNRPTDHGQLTDIASEVKESLNMAVIEATADKGYEDPSDHADALASGVIPNVIQRDGGSSEPIEFDYNETEITDDMINSTDPDDLRKCLEAGVVPAIYREVLEKRGVIEHRKTEPETAYRVLLGLSPTAMRNLALDGYFVRDAEANLVYCPAGEILRQKSLKRNGLIRYCNKLACKKCKSKCTASEFKEADFSKDQIIKKPRGTRKNRTQLYEGLDLERPKRMSVIKRKIQYVLRLDQNKMNQRKCLSEHPFGTIKRALGHYYFLLKGFAKVEAEMSLFCLSYNLRRIINIIGVPNLIQAIG